jgi:hypothetical protein
MVEFDPVALAEFISFEYNFGTKTILRDVRRLPPATLLIKAGGADGFVVTEEALLRTDFSVFEERMSREEAVRECAGLFRDSLASRVRKADELGLSKMADVSGGYDTRAVFAGLCGMDADFTSWCSRRSELGEGDQSEIARQLCRTFGRDLNTYDAPRFSDDLSEMRRLTYISDCTVECRTNAVRYQDSIERGKRSNPGCYAQFMGFGGEFIRHPYRLNKGYRSVGQMVSGGAYSRDFSPAEAARLVHVNPDDLVDVLEAEVANYPEQGDADKIKHVYFEYYSRLVNSGEDRHRLFHWTVQPLWGNDLFTFEMRHVRQEWFGFRFFTDFVGEIDPRALLVPIHGSHVKLYSKASVLSNDARARLKHLVQDIRPFVRLKGSPAYRAVRGQARRAGVSWVEHELIAAFDRSPAVASYFDALAVRSQLSRHRNQGELYTLLTVMLYVEEIEKRFGGRLR